jgi:AcrR family transcriptional regulator
MAQEQDVRTRILDAFLELVVERGVEGATYRDVAAQAGTSTGAVQYYFPEKALLIQEALIYAHGRAGEEFAGTSDGREHPGPVGRLRRRALRGLPLTDYVAQMAPFYVQYWAYAARDEATRRIHTERWERITLELEDVIARAFAEFGGLSPREIEDMASAIVALKFGLSVNSILHPERYTRATVRRIAEQFVETAIAAHRAHRGAGVADGHPGAGA